jgi:predicted RNA-binding Zn-ribbon protein involved in translation (DUF1610 family)
MSDQQAITVVSQSIMPAMEASQARARYEQLHAFIASQMVDGIDYGSIPGMEERKDPKTGEILPAKKVLLKPGAEKLSTFFALRPAFEDIVTVEDWTGKDHGEPFFYYRVKAVLYRGGERVCDADGSCNSMEKKYRYRQADRACPVCGKATIKRSKFPPKGNPQAEPGWYCYSKIGGCGTEFNVDNPKITDQQAGLVPNPDIADQVNTILKMAQKRALVAAILIGANASDYFTQDIEDDEPKAEPQARVVDVKPKKEAKVEQPQTVFEDGIPYPDPLDATVLYSFAKEHGVLPEAQAIMKENKLDVRKAWASLLKNHIPQADWPKG